MKKICSLHNIIYSLTLLIFLCAITGTYASTEISDEYLESAVTERKTQSKIPDDIEIVEASDVSPLADDIYTMEAVSGDIDAKTLQHTYRAPEKVSAKPTVIQRIKEIVKNMITPKSKQQKKVKLHLANKKTKPVPSSGSIKNGNTKTPTVGPPSKAEFCTRTFDEKKTMSIAQSATYLAPLLTIPQDIDELKRTEGSHYKQYIGAHNRFMCDDPHAPAIPKKAQAAYTTTINWSPTKYPQNYVECVAFVYMSYNMAGIKLPAGLGDAIDWKDKTDVFEVYESGKSSEPPRAGDVLVWGTDFGPVGHVAVITESKIDEINGKSGQVVALNANTKYVKLTYPVSVKDKSITVENGTLGQPKWWLRKKK